jgi:hypothetical protein
MPDAALLGLVIDRLETHAPADGAADLILAAFDGAGAVDAALHGEASGAPPSVAQRAAEAPSAVYLAAIEVEGFRGIGPPTTLHIDPGPGLTLVVGRNGSGKSSFSEALEMVLLGTNQRWEQRVKVWRDGWQNLHHRHTRVAARFTVDGRRQPLEVARVWKDDEGVDGSTLIVDGKPASTASLGWAPPDTRRSSHTTSSSMRSTASSRSCTTHSPASSGSVISLRRNRCCRRLV